MAAPTKEQIEKFEKLHKQQFIDLIAAFLFRVALAKKYGAASKAVSDYTHKIIPLVVKWYGRQRKLEKAVGIPKFNFDTKDFYSAAGLAKLQTQIDLYYKGKA